MPGIVVFGRRWSVGSDDLVLAAVLLLFLHIVWIVALGVILGVAEFDGAQECEKALQAGVLGYLVLLGSCLLIETIVACVSLRGNILMTDPRASMQYLLYIRLVLLLGEIGWMIRCIVWMVPNYTSCGPQSARKALLGLIVTNCVVVFIVIMSIWCTFDSAGRKWVKMKRYQESLKDKKRPGKRSGSTRRNWRQRKAFRAYEESWDRRLNILCCCIQRKGRNRNSIADVARLFTEFFRDLDVVPSDVIAGLALLRGHQKLSMKYTVGQGSNDVYEYLSGVPVTPRSQFLSLRQPDVLEMYKLVTHYMSFALAAYGWPAFLMAHTGTGLCRIIPHLRCCCCLSLCGRKTPKHSILVNDNCCHCNFAALNKISGLSDKDIVYVTYHVDVGETPFFVSLDHQNKNVVLSIRGTLSLQDIITDLKAEPEHLPIDPVKDEWYGHQGMVQAAVYIQKKLKQENILPDAFARDPSRGTPDYGLVLVGHSLGAGTASILAILLKQEYPKLHCYAFSPPGGLLSPSCVEETKHFITSVVIGKDVVPRIGLHQMECLRTDLINVIKQSTEPKWKIIASKLVCCKADDAGQDMDLYEMKLEMEKMDRDVTAHPLDSAIGLSAHKPLYPPGKIIHVVRSHPKSNRRLCGEEEPVYQAIWADNADFDEVLISPTMINDHMPDNVLEALQKVLINVGPAKPTRILSEAERKALLEQASPVSSMGSESHQKLFLETSFSNVDKDSLNHTIPGPDSPGYQDRTPVNCVTWNDLIVENENYRRDLPQGSCPHPLDPNCVRLEPNFSLDLSSGWSNSLVSRESETREPAPLASPEALSETSSLASFVSRSCSLRDSQYRLANEFPRMDRIVQSPQDPERPITSESPTKKSLKNGPTNKNRGVHFSGDEKTAKTEDNPTSDKREVKIAPVHKDIPNRHGWQEVSPVKETRFLETNLSDEDDMMPTNVCVIHSEPTRDKYKLSLVDERRSGDSDVSPDSGRASESGFYQRHSPVECSQHEYAQYLGHYSPAGRGYPHGAYHPPYRHSFSPSDSHVDPIQTVEVREGGVGQHPTPTSPTRRARICATHCTPVPSNQTSSPEDDYDKRLSAHSDDVFEFPLPLQQTDV